MHVHEALGKNSCNIIAKLMKNQHALYRYPWLIQIYNQFYINMILTDKTALRTELLTCDIYNVRYTLESIIDLTTTYI